jgi:hypothetical protein
MQQYYVAVGCAQSKLVTLLDLVRAVVSDDTGTRDEGCRKDLRIGICCSSRDSCDEVMLGVAQVLANARLLRFHRRGKASNGAMFTQ